MTLISWIFLLLLIFLSAGFGIYMQVSKQAPKDIKRLSQEKEAIQELIENTKQEYNRKLKEQLNNLQNIQQQKEKQEVEIINYTEKINNLTIQIDEKQKQLSSLIHNYQEQKEDSEKLLQQEIDKEKLRLRELMTTDIEAYTKEINKKKELARQEYEKEKANFDAILQDYQSKRESIIKISKEEEAIRQEAKFYTLNITPNEMADIEILERVKPSLSRPDILSKLIYKTYYEKPYTDLIGRVIGTKKITGIYKITNLINNKVYIGQAVDIAERWWQHIKRAVGAEPMTTNKLYPIMQEAGVYNFSWQVVEECKKEELTDKEKYWIKYYDGQGYGYNIKG